MIAHLRGAIHRLDPGEVSVDVQGVGYRVSVPVDVWEQLEEGQPAMLWISTYVREDRLELFGFSDRGGRTIFEEFLKISGIGPRMGLELCAVPRSLLLQATDQEDSRMLSNVKGVGKKTAEKLLLELRSLRERKPDIFGVPQANASTRHEYDQDAIAALSSLGYDSGSIMRILKDLPTDIQSTEARVAAALRSL